MSPFSCDREPEAIRAAWSGSSPAGWDDDLHQHVRSCAVCREAVQLAGVFREDREAAAREASIPASGVVWWRAQLRARREAARTAERPVALAQWLAVAGAMVVAVAGSLALVPSARAFFGSLAGALASPGTLFSSLGPPAGTFSSLSAWNLLAQPAILFVLAAPAVLAPVAIYLALAGE
jgi:hypothetical protein